MQFLSNARRLTKALKPPILLNSVADHNLFLSCSSCSSSSSSSSSIIQIEIAPRISHQWQTLNTLSSQSLYFSGIFQGNYLRMEQSPMHSRTAKASFSTESTSVESTPTEAVKELYDKILESVHFKWTMAPNAWLWSLIENCKNREDVKLLFDTLRNLRVFRLSNLRISSNFNLNLCREVTKACIRVGAIDFGKKTLWKHSVYGFSPNTGSVTHLLSYAKDHNDVKLMVEVMKLMKKNKIPPQPVTVDLVFSICHNSDNWELISKYSKRFVKAGVDIRKAAFGIWMDLAAKRGDTASLWKIEKLRSESWGDRTTLNSEFARAKGLILERKPEDAAAVIKFLYETYFHRQRQDIIVQLQKFVSEWPLDVVKYQPEEKRKALAAALKSDIPAMVTGLLNTGIEVNVNLEDLTSNKVIPC